MFVLFKLWLMQINIPRYNVTSILLNYLKKKKTVCVGISNLW